MVLFSQVLEELESVGYKMVADDKHAFLQSNYKHARDDQRRTIRDAVELIDLDRIAYIQ